MFRTIAIIVALALLLLAALRLFVFSNLAKMTLRKSLQPALEQMSQLEGCLSELKLEPGSSEPETLMNSDSLVREHKAMVSAIRTMVARLKQEIEQQNNLRVQAEVGAQANQVAHNIRSPLEALELILAQLTEVPEDKLRIMKNALREIRDLTNTVKARAVRTADATPANPKQISNTLQKTPQMLISLLDTVISERRAAFPLASIELTPQCQNTGFGLFVHANRTELRSVISNLINNAVEATPRYAGTVTIDVAKSPNGEAVIQIIDNGKGIAADLLPKLGAKGCTHGKANGSGLGLYHAKRTVEDIGGHLTIVSKVDVGTTVTIRLPLAQAPEWFTPSISIPENAELAILDDNESIHDVWNFRLNRLPTPMPGLRVHHFKTTSELKTWKAASPSRSPQVFLVDYEIHGDIKNGLDIIEELNIGVDP